MVNGLMVNELLQKIGPERDSDVRNGRGMVAGWSRDGRGNGP